MLAMMITGFDPKELLLDKALIENPVILPV
jgi:hypothetical protein